MVEKNDREQGNGFLFEFGHIVPAVLKCLFSHNLCKCNLPTWKKSYPYLLISAPIKDFLGVYNVQHHSQT